MAIVIIKVPGMLLILRGTIVMSAAVRYVVCIRVFNQVPGLRLCT
jgi:hypothetical protein